MAQATRTLMELQESLLIQACSDKHFVKQLSEFAKKALAATGLTIAAGVLGPTMDAHAGPLNSANCSAVGATVGAATGAAIGIKGGNYTKSAVFGTLGGFAGSVVGDYACAPPAAPAPAATERARTVEVRRETTPVYQSAPSPSTSYGNGGSREIISTPIYTAPGYGGVGAAPDSAAASSVIGLSIKESQLLDAAVDRAIASKNAWMEKVRAGAADKAVTASRDAFVSQRKALNKIVDVLGSGRDGGGARNVALYATVAGALSSVPTQGVVTYDQLRQADEKLKFENPEYEYRNEVSARKPSLK